MQLFTDKFAHVKINSYICTTIRNQITILKQHKNETIEFNVRESKIVENSICGGEIAEKYKEILPSFKTLLNNSNYQKYLSHLRRLSHSMRWNQQTRIFPISVMSHLVIITFLTYII